jgi:hypothetical protein
LCFFSGLDHLLYTVFVNLYVWLPHTSSAHNTRHHIARNIIAYSCTLRKTSPPTKPADGQCRLAETHSLKYNKHQLKDCKSCVRRCIPVPDGIYWYQTVYTGTRRYIPIWDGIYRYQTVYTGTRRYIPVPDGIYWYQTVYTDIRRHKPVPDGIYRYPYITVITRPCSQPHIIVPLTFGHTDTPSNQTPSHQSLQCSS